MAIYSAFQLLEENNKLKKEIEFLKERNKDLRQKTWYSVYEENLILRNQLKDSYNLNERLYCDYAELQKENNCLESVIKSVQEFTKQFT
jgi:hypothetical protein